MTPDWKDTHRLVLLRHLPYDSPEIRDRLSSGTLLRLTSEVAVPADHYRNLPPWGQAEARAAAVGLTVDKGVVAGKAAARLWGVELLHVEKEVEVQLPGRARASGRRTWTTGARYRSVILPDRYHTVERGIRVTTPMRCLLDIARHESPHEAVVALDSARRLWPGLTVDVIRRDIALMGPVRNGAKFHAALERSLPGIGSPWETLARLLLLDAALPAIHTIETQVGFRDPLTGRSYFVDILINGWLVLEVDGRSKYRGAYGDTPAAVVLAERDREKALQNLGRVVLRVGKSELTDGGAGECTMLQMVRRALHSFTAPDSLPRAV